MSNRFLKPGFSRRRFLSASLGAGAVLTFVKGPTRAAETTAQRGIPQAAQSLQSPETMNAPQPTDLGTLPDGTVVKSFTLRNANGLLVKVMSYGAILSEIRVPDRQGHSANVVLGSDTLAAYLSGHPAPAAVIGRVANRIAKARFTLDGKEYILAANNGPNHIHGGRRNFAQMAWNTESLPSQAGNAAVRFSYLSPDGEEGYPGNLKVAVTYTLTPADELRLNYTASTDRPTPVNLTNHAYFNLAGSGDALGHLLWLPAEHYTPADDQLIPTGEIAPVRGTPLDFTQPRVVGDRISQLKPRPGGYDHNYVLGNETGALRLCARLSEPHSGRIMEVSTTEPGVQLYTGNHLRNWTGTDGAEFGPHGGLCLETQHYPDSVNHPHFPSVILRPGQTFRSTTVFKFRV
ncbi:MAG TPA: aldose epimerase family protein [Verrucomicrobiota bacterium]|nr:aldose epimerase family protein [Verrucomicrobiota bacterium]HNU51737.1 aldose epimerase family protein [Verrucomicrobiota bacterium]